MKQNQSQIAILIPCYNEAQTIGKVVRDFHAALPDAQIYVYDNNSTDDTVKIAKKAGAIIRHEYQQGKGNVVRRMFQEIDADCYILVDGDDTYPAESAVEMCDKVLNYNSDMVVGDRLSSTYFEENQRPFHNLGNSLVLHGINWIFNSDIKDIMTGYRAFGKRFVKTFPVLSKGFEIETEMTIHAVSMNLQVDNVVVAYRDRPDGSESKLNTVSDGLRVISTMVRLFQNYKPLRFFTIISVVLFIIDLAVLTPAVFIPYQQTGIVEKFPTLIVGGVVAMISLLLYVCGLILSAIWQKERREFEFRLMIVSKLYENKK